MADESRVPARALPEGEPPIERVRKWCPDKRHIGPREFEGWAFRNAAPVAAVARVEVDEEGRHVHLCDSCIDRHEQERARRARRRREQEREDTELERPTRELPEFERGDAWEGDD